MVRAFLVGSMALMLLVSAGCNKERDEDDCPSGTCARVKTSCSGSSCSVPKTTKAETSDKKIEIVEVKYEAKAAVPQVVTKDGKQYWDGALIIKRGDEPPSFVTYVFAEDLEKCKQCVGFRCEPNK